MENRRCRLHVALFLTTLVLTTTVPAQVVNSEDTLLSTTEPAPIPAEQERVTHEFSRDWLEAHAKALSQEPFELP